MHQPTLVIMAAGMGSRFGGPKQITPVDPQGHIIIDFSLFDAWRAGFRRVAFIIKPEMEEDFRQRIGRRMEQYFEVLYIHQTLDVLPEGYCVPAERVKPWGTGHAVACCRGAFNGPFAVINADDFYGPSAFTAIYNFLTSNTDENAYAMVGYRLRNTVTEHGSVARGVCQVQSGKLINITERTKIFKRGDDAAYTEDGETFIPISGESIVSMNLWGFTADFLDTLEARFAEFLGGIAGNEIKAEFLLPEVVGSMIRENKAEVKVLTSNDRWFGVTYHEDKDLVVRSFRELYEKGQYPEQLFK